MTGPNRRQSLALLGAVLALPPAGAASPPLLGIMNFGAPPAEGGPPDAMPAQLARLGLQDGVHLRYQLRYARGQRERFDELLNDLLRREVDLIHAAGSDITRVLLAKAPRVPVVFIASDDPVESGLVRSLAQPGGWLTGMTMMSPQLGGKRLETLKLIVPGLRRVAVMYDRYHAFYLEQMKAPAAVLGLELEPLGFEDAGDFAGVFARARRAGAEAMFVAPNRYTLVFASRIAELSVQQRMPAISAYDSFARAGGLLSYGPVQADALVRAAEQIARVLHGEHPSRLPVEQLSRIVLIANQKTARAMGVSLPAAILARADEVIE